MKRFSASTSSSLFLLASLVFSVCATADEDFPPPPHRFLLGPASGSDATVWVQSEGEALVRLELLDPSSGQWEQSETALTLPEAAFTAVLGVSGFEPEEAQVARLRVTGEPVDPLFAIQTAPPSYFQGDFSIAVVSGAAASPTTIEAERISQLLDAKKPVATIWVGGLSHLDESRWNSARGYASAHAQVRAKEHLQPLFVRTQNLPTWGPADYGPMGAGKSLWSRHLARDAFDLYWPTPLKNVQERPFGVGGWSWRWGDVEVFFLDSQWWRTGSGEKAYPSVVGNEQMDWLLDAIDISPARFHLVALGEPLLASDSRAARADVERLQGQLRKRGLPGLVILAGAPTSPGELSLSLDKRPPIYELAISGFRDPRFDEERFLNYQRTPGSLVQEPHMAFIEFSGINQLRYMRISVHELGGEEAWALRIPLPELAPHQE